MTSGDLSCKIQTHNKAKHLQSCAESGSRLPGL